MKKFLITLTLFSSTLYFTQVGINTTNPQGTLHVDGAKDNPASGLPTASQQANDMVVTNMGRMGLGTITPTTRLEVNNGTTNGAIRIVDGTQAADRVLMSDANGLATWRTPASIKPTVVGVIESTAGVNSNLTTGYKYSNYYITLSQGKWVVNAGLTIRASVANTRFWLHSILSTSKTAQQSTGFNFLGPAADDTSFADIIENTGDGSNDKSLNFMSGSSVIEVTAPSVTIYLLIENKFSGSNSYWNYGPNSFENYFYANPLN